VFTNFIGKNSTDFDIFATTLTHIDTEIE